MSFGYLYVPMDIARVRNWRFIVFSGPYRWVYAPAVQPHQFVPHYTITITNGFSFYKKHIFDFTTKFCNIFHFIFQYFDSTCLIYCLITSLKPFTFRKFELSY